MCLLAAINRSDATGIIGTSCPFIIWPPLLASAKTANFTRYTVQPLTSRIFIGGSTTVPGGPVRPAVLLEQSLALLGLMLAKVALAHFLTALVALNPPLFAMVVQMRHIVIQAQLGLSALIHTGKRGIPQHTLHRLATVPEVRAERLLAGATRLSTGNYTTADTSRRQLLSILEPGREARFADLLATVGAVFGLDGQVGAVRAGELVEVPVVARVQLEQLALDVFQAEVLAALFLADGERVIVQLLQLLSGHDIVVVVVGT